MTNATDLLMDKEMLLDETSSQDSLRHSIGQGKVGSFLTVSIASLGKIFSSVGKSDELPYWSMYKM